MQSAMIFILCTTLLFASNAAAPLTLSDIFSDYVENAKLASAQQLPQEVVKRQIVVPSNPDAKLKEISLQALIDDLENSLVSSAISLSSANAADTAVHEVAVREQPEHKLSKRHSEQATIASSTVAPAIDESTEVTALAKQIYLQTTKRVPETAGIPAHLIIDHVSVQPHTAGIALIPAFQVHHTKLITAAIKDDKAHENTGGDTQTKISITKTSIVSASTANVESAPTTTLPVETTTSLSSTTEGLETTTEIESSTTPTPTLQQSSSTAKAEVSTSTTAKPEVLSTKEPIVQLKEEEKKLKEKVAEIEAEPVILSARV